MTVRILDMTPICDRGPSYGGLSYRFHTSYPTRNVRRVGQVVSDPELAHEQAQTLLREYIAQDPRARSGEVLGVAESGGGYQGVVNTYHSNS